MNINWSEKPEGFPIWIEDLHPEEFADGSGWHRDDGDRYTDQDGMHWRKPARDYYRVHLAPEGEAMSAKSVLENMTEQDYKIIALEATVAQQAKMIEHLRGGPTPLYTAVDMANAARDGFRDRAASLLRVLEMARPYVGLEGSEEELAQLEAAISAITGKEG